MFTQKQPELLEHAGDVGLPVHLGESVGTFSVAGCNTVERLRGPPCMRWAMGRAVQPDELLFVL